MIRIVKYCEKVLKRLEGGGGGVYFEHVHY